MDQAVKSYALRARFAQSVALAQPNGGCAHHPKIGNIVKQLLVRSLTAPLLIRRDRAMSTMHVMAPKQMSAGGTEVPASAEELTRRNIESISRLEQEMLAKRTIGDRVADVIAAFCGALMSMSFLLAGRASTNPILFTAAILILLAWLVAGYWAADRLLPTVSGTPCHPGRSPRRGPTPARSTR